MDLQTGQISSEGLSPDALDILFRDISAVERRGVGDVGWKVQGVR